jgi:glycosyltransferase involved in cell wall biosynthesis
MISLCITTYNRFDLLLESFDKVLGDPRISEIIIVDDNSKPEICNLLSETLSGSIYAGRVTFHINQENIGMSRNKARAVELASNPWCILFDSDNVIDSSYLNALPEYLAPSVIYCPDFAKPQFDYRKYSGHTINADNAAKIMSKPMGECLFNTCNYLVNRDEYLHVYEYNQDMKGTDTIWFNYLWLKAGNSLNVVPGMQYIHRVHAGSGFMEDVDYNMKKSKEVKQLIQTLR